MEYRITYISDNIYTPHFIYILRLKPARNKNKNENNNIAEEYRLSHFKIQSVSYRSWERIELKTDIRKNYNNK